METKKLALLSRKAGIEIVLQYVVDRAAMNVLKKKKERDD
jgi:hypothetical protein